MNVHLTRDDINQIVIALKQKATRLERSANSGLHSWAGKEILKQEAAYNRSIADKLEERL
jgi:hypothetical protein